MNVSNSITLSEEQEAACQKAEQWLKEFEEGVARRPFFVIEGFAGTGKSFSVQEIIRRLGRKAAYMTYTGKAALVLNKYSNVGATTIHSRIYRLKKVPDTVFEKLFEQKEAAASDLEAKDIQAQIDDLMKPRFELNDNAFSDDDTDLIVLDECSMVDEEILHDLESFGIPIIALGDPGQLPPVKGEGALFSGVADARLTEIRRQALDNPIIKWSMYVREQRVLPSTYPQDWETDLASKLQVSMVTEKLRQELAQKHDIIICWKNETRRNLNRWYRRVIGLYEKDGVFPVEGDTIIFTKNDKEVGVFNGLFAKVVSVGQLMDTYIELTVMPETFQEGDDPIKVKVMRACFEEYNDPDIWKSVRPWDYRGRQQADFGYAITCHKAQGSQWDRVLVFEENVFNWFKPGIQEQRARWLYTAITRAAKKLTMIVGKI